VSWGNDLYGRAGGKNPLDRPWEHSLSRREPWYEMRDKTRGLQSVQKREANSAIKDSRGGEGFRAAGGRDRSPLLITTELRETRGPCPTPELYRIATP